MGKWEEGGGGGGRGERGKSWTEYVDELRNIQLGTGIMLVREKVRAEVR
jgi:hypothetical protein